MTRRISAITVVSVLFSLIPFLAVKSSAQPTFSFLKIIDLSPLQIPGSIEVDVVGDELLVASFTNQRYYRLDPATETVLGSFRLPFHFGDHGSDYDLATHRLLHVIDDDRTARGVDTFAETDLNGRLTRGLFDIFNPGDDTEDPGGLAVDPTTGRVWIAIGLEQAGPKDIYEISRVDGTSLGSLGASNNPYAVSYNTVTNTLFYVNLFDQTLYEIHTDGSRERAILTLPADVGELVGLSFTPTGDLVLLSFGFIGLGLNTLFLFDSDADADLIFTVEPLVDTDGDGVPDALDLCPNTLVGEPVDLDGCSASQLDGDGDGVPDSVDQCPSEDATGLDLNLDGCKDRAADLIQLTQSFGLPLGISNGLVAKLQQAANANSIQAASALLEAFKNEVEAQRGKAITNEQADLLVAMADNGNSSGGSAFRQQ